MKLKKQNERVVFLGGKNEDLSWGWVQFPNLYAMRNGNIGMCFHDDYDNWVSLDGDSTERWLVSRDGGVSWENATEEDKDMMGVVLPNGDVIRSYPNPPTSLKGVKEAPLAFGNVRTPADSRIPEKSNDPKQLPHPITVRCDVWQLIYKVYWLDTVPDELVEKRLCFHRLKNGETKAEKYYTMPDWKYRTVQSFEPRHPKRTDIEDVMLNNAGLYTCRDIKVAPDGSLYLAHYRPDGANPFTGVYEGTYNTYILRSVDNGDTWKLISYIPYKNPDEENDPFAHLKGGFPEPTLEFMPDGSILCILRTCDVFSGDVEWGPTYITRSTDGGVTWEQPKYFKDRGALPKLLQMKNGVTLAVITRPGIYVYASDDSGRTWSEPLEIMTDADRSHLANVPPKKPDFHQWAGSCCNCSIYPLSDNKALLAFSDFYTPDENGVKRKGIKTVEIIIE